MSEIFKLYREVFYQYPEFPLYMCTFLFVLGILYLFFAGEGKNYSAKMLERLNSPAKEDEIFLNAGININANRYKLFIYISAILFFIVRLIIAASTGTFAGISGSALLSIAAVYFLLPRRYIYKGIRSPFMIAVGQMAKKRRRELDYELYSSVTMLKNLAIAQEANPLSFDMIMERLMECSKKLKPIYQKTLSLYRSDNMVLAMRYFSGAIGTKNARNFTLILEKMDKINPTELKSRVSGFQEGIAEEMFTRGMEKAESRGTVVYVLATAVSFVCLLNFIFVSVLIDTIGTLGELL